MLKSSLAFFALGLAGLVGLFAWRTDSVSTPGPWSAAETETLRSMAISELKPPPASLSNRVADNPKAAKMGRRIFFDPQFSANGQVACANCHLPGLRFADGLTKGQAIGQSKRNTPSLVGTAYSPWLYWDGRKDSLWSQALAPLEDPNEHGSSRVQLVRLLTTSSAYRKEYEQLFGPAPDFSDQGRFPENASPLGDALSQSAWRVMSAQDRASVNSVFANLGKSIAAYLRRLSPGSSRFDMYVQAVLRGDYQASRVVLDDDEISGLRLFIGRANCTQCHNGPLLTNHEFHNTGVISSPGESPDTGRVRGVRDLLRDAFNCLGDYTDDVNRSCDELRFVREGPELIGAFKTPSLRNLDGTAPYMHKGQLDTLADVLDHYNLAPLAMIGHNESVPLTLNRRELQQLEKFLRTLTAPVILTPQSGAQ